MGYELDFRFLAQYETAFVRGMILTLWISLSSFVIGTCAGLPVGFALRFFRPRSIILFINDAVRAIPPLVMLLLIYYTPWNSWLGIPSPGAITTSILGLGIIQAAYTGDLVRNAIDGVPETTLMGARALGLKESLIWQYVILPDVVRQIMAPELAFFIGTIRASSIASVIGAGEVVFVARVSSSQNFRTIEAWLVVGAIYVALVWPLAILERRVENFEWMKRR
jgi:polar amino acid transport system permease protein